MQNEAAGEPQAPVKDAKQRLKEFKENTKKKAISLVCEVLPQRVMELNTVLEGPDFKLKEKQCHAVINVPRPPPANEAGGEGSNYLEVGCVNGTKVLALPGGVVAQNKVIERVHEIVKPLVVRLIDDCNVLRMWIHFLIPKVEDGNNFGVEIQEECLTEVSEIQKDAASYLDQVARYFVARAKAISKVAKYPHVEDFRKHIDELDEKQYYTVQLTVLQLRNDYAVMHDFITKNMEKIQTPRHSNVENLY